MLPRVEGHVGTNIAKSAGGLFTKAYKFVTNKTVTNTGGIILGGKYGGTVGAVGVVLSQIRSDPAMQYALVLAGISMFLYRYMAMKMAANARRHNASERAKNRQHQLALINKQQELVVKLMNRQAQAIPDILRGLYQGRDPSISGLIANN
jgi:hypothetical protein